jgi:hypothetical protein
MIETGLFGVLCLFLSSFPIVGIGLSIKGKIDVGWALPTKNILQSETKWWAMPTLHEYL